MSLPGSCCANPLVIGLTLVLDPGDSSEPKLGRGKILSMVSCSTVRTLRLLFLQLMRFWVTVTDSSDLDLKVGSGLELLFCGVKFLFDRETASVPPRYFRVCIYARLKMQKLCLMEILKSIY